MARETQHMAVLFADISDSSYLYKTLGDVPARGIVNSCLALMSGVVVRFKGRIIKTIGDEIMCAFARSDDAVLAASEIQVQIEAKRPGDRRIKIHSGLHYGPVLVEGNDIFGYTVNAAAYLTAVAAPDQILTTDATERALAPELRTCVRPVFRVVLKGSDEESTISQVVWQKDTAAITNVSLGAQRLIPGDEGSLKVTLGTRTVRLDHANRTLTIGRGSECDLVVTELFASRQHLRIRLLRTHFYLFDQSINGTFVTLDNGKEVQVLRGELLLEGSGSLALGRSAREGAADIVSFARDRRSIYRVA
ncbi:MAG: adenylate/guanylate cyclase domain-containing protein [Betaproteobacteria bacterium]|nr:adenylate/guanylate cyclase domain-containing protein [Betaproteobacteria bacterium]MBI2290646.1 adenylate/guanylate cyclase domain-containing protein [Betaproteobacteria bacterium]MBI3057115.1 adenylate/guanylate cyclase domain-containing protein [Betaproteobacteria bacterium]